MFLMYNIGNLACVPSSEYRKFRGNIKILSGYDKILLEYKRFFMDSAKVLVIITRLFMDILRISVDI